MTVLTSVGLGLRRDFIDSFLNLDTYPDFIEVAPENWMVFGGRHAKLLEQCAEKHLSFVMDFLYRLVVRIHSILNLFNR